MAETDTTTTGDDGQSSSTTITKPYNMGEIGRPGDMLDDYADEVEEDDSVKSSIVGFSEKDDPLAVNPYDIDDFPDKTGNPEDDGWPEDY